MNDYTARRNARITRNRKFTSGERLVVGLSVSLLVAVFILGCFGVFS